MPLSFTDYFAHRKISRAAALALSIAGLTFSASAQNAQTRNVSFNNAVAPIVTLEADSTTLTRCATDNTPTPNQVRLNTRTENLSGNVNYSYSTTGGRVIGSGANATWDLSDVQPGVYTATVEADNAFAAEGCKAFSSAVVVVRDCAPVAVRCPVVRVLAPENTQPGKPLTFVAQVGSGGNIAPNFTWTVSGGKITSGQGTPAITVDTAGLGGTNVTAALQLAGYDPSCSAVAEATSPVVAPPLAKRFDEFPSITFDDDKARLDNLAVELQNDPTSRAFVIVYTAKDSRTEQTTRLGGRARDYLVRSRGIDASRITVVGGGKRERNSFELYIIPQGAEPPAIGR